VGKLGVVDQMRLLFISANYQSRTIGGAQKSIELLAGGLIARGHQAMVLKPSEHGKSAHSIFNGVDVHEYGRTNLYWPFDQRPHSKLAKLGFHSLDLWNPLVYRQTVDLLKRLQPDIVHSNVLAGTSVSIWQAARSVGIPIVHTLRDYYLLCINSGMQKGGVPCEEVCRGCSVAKKLARSTTGNCSAVVGNSAFILNEHLRHGYFKGVRHRKVIFTGAEELDGGSPTPRTVLPRLPILGYFGRLSPSKGVLELVRAANALKGSVRLLVGGAGDSAFVASLKGEADPAVVEFLGTTTPAAFYPRIDLLCLPSLWPEPLSRTIMEAYTYGVPVLASPTGGSPEVVIPRETGFLLDFRKPEELADAISQLHRDVMLYPTMAANSLIMSQRLSLSRTVCDYEALYRDVLVDAGHLSQPAETRECA